MYHQYAYSMIFLSSGNHLDQCLILIFGQIHRNQKIPQTNQLNFLLLNEFC